MEVSRKIRLSSSVGITEFICVGVALLGLKLLFDEGRNNADIDFETDLAYKALFIMPIAFLFYFLTRSKIYYDEINLYIKKINKKEIIIPLKHVKSFFENPLSLSRGFTTFSIEFADNAHEDDSIKFRAIYWSKNIKNFKMLIKKINPEVEIV